MHGVVVQTAESILQLDPPTNAAIGPSRALRRAATSKNPTTCTLPSDVISHNLIHTLDENLLICPRLMGTLSR